MARCKDGRMHATGTGSTREQGAPKTTPLPSGSSVREAPALAGTSLAPLLPDSHAPPHVVIH
jgi:hypothetical protein